MSADATIDRAELEAMVKPIREQLGWARREVMQLRDARLHCATKAERLDAQRRLPLARARRDLYQAILADVQRVIDSEGEVALSRFTREFLELQVEVKPVASGVAPKVEILLDRDSTERARQVFADDAARALRVGRRDAR